MRFSYYQRLSAEDRRTYRRSDAVAELPLADPRALAPLVAGLERALASGKTSPTRRAAQDLCAALCRRFEVVTPNVQVRARRPRDREGELHGLYTYEDPDHPIIEVWMRTAAERRVVAFRTFLRTLLHELVHHFDLTWLKLPETFHTEGFFKRESSLARQLAPRVARTRVKTAPSKPRATPGAGPAPERAVQLDLFAR